MIAPKRNTVDKILATTRGKIKVRLYWPWSHPLFTRLMMVKKAQKFCFFFFM